MSFPPELLVGLAGGRSGGLIACLPQAGIFYIKNVDNFLKYSFLKRCGYTVATVRQALFLSVKDLILNNRRSPPTKNWLFSG
jgi:hypothetical protein